MGGVPADQDQLRVAAAEVGRHDILEPPALPTQQAPEVRFAASRIAREGPISASIKAAKRRSTVEMTEFRAKRGA